MFQSIQNSTQFDKQLEEWQRNDSLMLNNDKLLNKIHQKSKTYILTQNSTHHHKSRPSSSPAKPIEIKNSINQLRFLSHQEQQQTQNIKNRLKYLQTSIQRQEKLVHSAKQKYNQINQIRRQTFADKSLFSKQRENLLYQHSRTVSLQANKVKSQRYKISESQKNILLEKHNIAQAVKQQRQINESSMKERKQKQKSLLCKRVQKIHRQQDQQRHKISSRSRQKVQQGIHNHKKYLLQHYQKIQRQMKENQKMLRSFSKKASIICEKKKKQQGQLEQFHRYLGLNKSERNYKTGRSVLDEELMCQSVKKQSQSAQSTGWSFSPKRILFEKQFYLTTPQK